MRVGRRGAGKAPSPSNFTPLLAPYQSRIGDLFDNITPKEPKELGFGINVEPIRAFYVFVNSKRISGDSYKLAFDILEKAHFGVTPGIHLGGNGGGYPRLTYGNSIEDRLRISPRAWTGSNGIWRRSYPALF